jgi:hypothetical protein
MRKGTSVLIYLVLNTPNRTFYSIVLFQTFKSSLEQASLNLKSISNNPTLDHYLSVLSLNNIYHDNVTKNLHFKVLVSGCG